MIDQIKAIIKRTQPAPYLQVLQACVDLKLGVIDPKTTIASLLEMGEIVKDDKWNLRLRQ
jgi:hypothetical protein